MNLLPPKVSSLDGLQKISLSLMFVLALLTFVATNVHALLWQSSAWLVSTVLPAVVVELTNEERAENAAMPLQRNAVLDQAAQMKAEHMAHNEYFSHFSPEGVSPWYWFNEAGYVYAYAGENLAIHFTDSSEVVAAWMESPTHRANIVDGKYTEIGVGAARGEFEGYETVYVVQLFGTPAIMPEAEPESAAAAELSTDASKESAAFTFESVVVEDENFTPAKEFVEVDKIQGTQTEDIQSKERIITLVDDVVVVETPVIATSSGLAVANITMPTPTAGTSKPVAAIATQPSRLLQGVYAVLAISVLFLLVASIVFEARRFNYAQVAYGLVLMLVMGGLWYVHILLTAGAVIV